MQALADAGPLTQEQADKFSLETQNNLWATLSQNGATNSSVKTAPSTMRQARDAMVRTLHNADINVMPATATGTGCPTA